MYCCLILVPATLRQCLEITKNPRLKELESKQYNVLSQIR